MKLNIIIPDFTQDIKDEKYFEYSLGWFEFETKEMRISFFKDDLCMIFPTLNKFIEHISYLKKHDEEKVLWIGEDNGSTFTLSIKKNKIFISNDTIKVSFKLKKIKKAFKQAAKNMRTKIKKHNGEIVFRNLF